MNATNHRKVFQAGYADGLNGWYVCGYGFSQAEAKADLKKRIHIRACESVAEQSRGLFLNHKITMSAESAAGAYQSEVEYLESGRYIERFYQERIEEAV